MGRRKREGDETSFSQGHKIHCADACVLFSVFQPRSSSDSAASLNPRTQYTIPLTWCCPGTATAVTITVFNAYAYLSDGDMRVLDLLTDSLAHVQHILSYGDGVVPRGAFTFTDYGVSFYLANANNHQQTYGVVAGAIIALSEFMNAYGAYGYAHFQIFDGGNQVGTGTLGPG